MEKVVKSLKLKGNGLVDIKYRDGICYEMHPDLAQKLVAAKVAEYK